MGSCFAAIAPQVTVWFIIAGLVFCAVALAATSIKHLPLSASLVYFCLGVLLGPHGAGLLRIELPRDAPLLEHLTELVIIVSLFATGLNLRAAWRDSRWSLVLRLGFGATMVTAALIACVGVWLLDLSWGAALLLGGLLAPTDPVLARDVQLEHPFDPSTLRFGLTGEAGLNDGVAFPIVLLGLALLTYSESALRHASTSWSWPMLTQWLVVDVIWSIAAGLAIGWAIGTLIGRLVLHLRLRYREAVGLDHFLAIGMISLSYGVALAAHGYGFLAVFAAGLAVRQLEIEEVGEHPPRGLTQVAIAPSERTNLATDEKRAPIYLAQTALRYTELIEQIGEVIVVTLAGALLAPEMLSWPLFAFALLLFFVIRPTAIAVALPGAKVRSGDEFLIAWFGIRGLASIYYFAYALTHGLTQGASFNAFNHAATLLAATVVIVGLSVVVHGISVTPLMRYHARIHASGRTIGGPLPPQPSPHSSP